MAEGTSRPARIISSRGRTRAPRDALDRHRRVHQSRQDRVRRDAVVGVPQGQECSAFTPAFDDLVSEHSPPEQIEAIEEMLRSTPYP